MPEEINTEKLRAMIMAAGSFDGVSNIYGDWRGREKFAAHINRLCAEKGLSRADVIDVANVEKTFGYEIFRGEKKPSRGNVLRLAFGLKLNYAETEELLKIAGEKSLDPKVRRDGIVIFALCNNIPLMEVQIKLDDLNLKPLGEESPRKSYKERA